MLPEAEKGAALDAVVDRLRNCLRPAAVVLYGSAAKGRTHGGSDIDIAVLLDRPSPAWDDVGRLRVDLAELAGRDVDLTVLNDASPILVMEILRTGTLVDCAVPEAFEAFAVRTFTDYADLKITRRSIEERLLPAVTHEP